MDKKKQSTEELVNTQVLNIDEVRKVANYERKTSKKPASICALIGAIMILIGGGAQGYITYNNRVKENMRKQNDVVERKINEEEQEEKTPIVMGNSSLICTLSMQANPNGTNYVSTFTYNFIDSKLKTIKKDIILDALPEDPLGPTSMQNLYTAYQTYAMIDGTVNGYNITTGPRGTIGFFAITDIDLNVLNPALIPENYNKEPQLSVDYKLDTNMEKIKKETELKGYACVVNTTQSQQQTLN